MRRYSATLEDLEGRRLASADLMGAAKSADNQQTWSEVKPAATPGTNDRIAEAFNRK